MIRVYAKIGALNRRYTRCANSFSAIHPIYSQTHKQRFYSEIKNKLIQGSEPQTVQVAQQDELTP